MASKRPKDPISRGFRQDFPEFVERAQNLGVRIRLERKRNGPRVYWLDGYLQLTGYERNQDGSPFTYEDAVRNIDKALTDIEDDRRSIADMSEDERFARVMAEFARMVPQYRRIGEVRLPAGDKGHCFFLTDFDGAVSLHEIGTVARATAKWRQGITPEMQMAEFCEQLRQDYEQRSSIQGAGDER